jgi:protein TonB
MSAERAAVHGALDETGRRGPAWAASVALHAVALGVLLHLSQRAPFVPAPTAVPLVYVAPAPAPPAPVGAPTGVVDAPAVVAPSKEIAPATPQPARPAVRAPRPPRPPAPRPAPAQREALGSAEGLAGGAAGGTPAGLVGGQPGGRGDTPVPAERVAHPPVPIDEVLPTYPPMARARGLEGVVLLRAVVDREGRVEDDVSVVRSVPTFDQAAVAAFRRWRFQPGRDGDGATVRVVLEIPIRFQLR